jgi:hypothetical protein
MERFYTKCGGQRELEWSYSHFYPPVDNLLVRNGYKWRNKKRPPGFESLFKSKIVNTF